MTYNMDDRDGYQSLHVNQKLNRWQYSVKSGCGVTINSGTLGQADTLTVASGEIIHNGSSVSVASQSVQIDAANLADPRKDVVYLDSTGTAQVAKGTAEAAQPSSATRFQTYRPAPEDLSATNAVELAEVWVPADSSSITSDDLENRRVNADLTVNSVGADEIGLKKHLIYIFTSSGDLLTSIDPASSSNPIQDAWDAAGNEGTILYPPGEISFNTTLSGAGGICHIGTGGPGGGTTPTSFLDMDETTPSYEATTAADERDCYFTGIQWNTNTTPRTAVGFLFNTSPRRWNLGRNMRFGNYDGSDLFHFNTGAPYSSEWQSPMASGYNRFIKADTLGAPLTLQAPYLGSGDETTPEILINDPGHIYLTHGWNKGGTACPLFIGTGSTAASQYVIGRGNWEPSTDAGAIDYVIEHSFDASVTQFPFRLGGTSYTLNNEHIKVGNANANVKRIMSRQNTVGITTDVNQVGSVVYDGPSDNVNNRTGALTTAAVHCLGDGVFKKSTGTGNDGGTDDIVYGPG